VVFDFGYFYNKLITKPKVVSGDLIFALLSNWLIDLRFQFLLNPTFTHE
jgi:hypothetical protein